MGADFDCILVRYGEIGCKSEPVRSQMKQVLRQRVEDRMKYESLDFEKIRTAPGRIIVETSNTAEATGKISEIPGVKSASPAFVTETALESVKKLAERFEYGETFAVDVNRTGGHDFTSQEAEEILGSHVEDYSGSSVDLDNPDTCLEVDIRGDRSYVFTERQTGPGGLPVGTQGEIGALVSGGIDSPVAAYQAMKRGADIMPIYFYNRPLSAEDHLARFEASVRNLKRFHPGKKWEYFIVDMKEVNEKLLRIGKGRMVLHRVLMFRIASSIAEKEGLNGLVTGESLGQKSTQTSHNLALTASESDETVMRPLIGWNKEEIVGKAKELGTYREAIIDSACRSIAPENPATRLSEEKLNDLKDRIDTEGVVEKAASNTEKREL